MKTIIRLFRWGIFFGYFWAIFIALNLVFDHVFNYKTSEYGYFIIEASFWTAIGALICGYLTKIFIVASVLYFMIFKIEEYEKEQELKKSFEFEEKPEK